MHTASTPALPATGAAYQRAVCRRGEKNPAENFRAILQTAVAAPPGCGVLHNLPHCERAQAAARSTPPHLPPPTEHRECAVIIKASGARLVAMHAVKMTVPTQGSVRTTTPSVACTLPVNRKGRGARAWGPWRSRGDVRWGDRAPARENKQNQHTKRQLHNAAKQGVASCGPVVSRGADSVVESGIRPR